MKEKNDYLDNESENNSEKKEEKNDDDLLKIT